MIGPLQAEVLGVDIRQFAEQNSGCALALHEHVRQQSILNTYAGCVCVYTPEHGDRVSQLCSILQVKFQAGGARSVLHQRRH